MYLTKSLRTMLAGSACVIALATATAATAQSRDFSVPAGELQAALDSYAQQAGIQLLYRVDLVKGVSSKGASGNLTTDRALEMVLADTGLKIRRHASGAVAIVPETSGPQSGSAAGGGAEVEALIVTAQKREEDIQDVPIAISAFTQEALEAQKIEGGFDLLKAIPNVTFSKNNFTSYNFSIRGVGTKAVSATTDPGVSVSFNNTGIIQNRLFEQEYFDIERVEVLRGPQGTLYGRNATSGVINVISAKPDLDEFEGFIKGEVGNYHTKRVSAMVNVPLVEDKLAVRLAGAMTNRQGYDFNTVTGSAVNGRDLWSARLTLGFEPTEWMRGNAIWERFEEDDDRLRTGKQLCHRDPDRHVIGTTPVHVPNPDNAFDTLWGTVRPALFSTGCQAGSLYADGAFGTPNGLAIPFIFGAAVLGNVSEFAVGADDDGNPLGLIKLQDPYGGLMQSRNMREIASLRDPHYSAKADLFELNLEFDLSPALTLSSQTAYVDDQVYSFQDFNRFNTLPVFNDTSTYNPGTLGRDWRDLAPGGVFCDPQIGCSDTIAGFDISQASAEQFSQEIRLQSDFDGPVNFSLGANYTTFDVLVDYYIMFNLITAVSLTAPFNAPIDGVIDFGLCGFPNDLSVFLLGAPPTEAVPNGTPGTSCPYIDPNPVESIAGDGHNYFRSKNPYNLKSWAGFGEVYWNLTDALKVTAGLRYTNDEKSFTPVPSQILLATSVIAGGNVNRGYPELAPIEQEWGEWTGRLGIDWKPDLGWTDDTLLYAFYSHGYKGGGANPPKPGFQSADEFYENASADALFLFSLFGGLDAPILELTADEYGDTFEPEYVDAFELGMKNTLLGGALTFNSTAFFYDYTDYQVSQIRDRTAVNENFDATVWGIEFETLFAPSRNLQIVANLGYLDTKIADGERSIDIINRNQGDPGYTVTKPWLQLPSNCVVPTPVVERWLTDHPAIWYWNLCSGVGGFLGILGQVIDPETGVQYDPADYPELNGGAGLYADLGGNELPNAPHWTANVGAQYGMDMFDGWRATVRGDLYWQSQSYHRVYNYEPYDKLRGWYNANLSLWVENDEGLKIELYAKNILNDTPITDAFLNSDDTGLTTNVFTLDPRLIGLSIKKEF